MFDSYYLVTIVRFINNILVLIAAITVSDLLVKCFLKNKVSRVINAKIGEMHAAIPKYYLDDIAAIIDIFLVYLLSWIIAFSFSSIVNLLFHQADYITTIPLTSVTLIALCFRLFDFFTKNNIFSVIGIVFSTVYIINALDPNHKLNIYLDKTVFDLIIVSFSIKQLLLLLTQLIVVYSVYRIWKRATAIIIDILVRDTNKQIIYRKILKYFGILISMVLFLKFTGINPKSLAIITGAIGVGMGFGLQKITSNVVSGAIIFFEKRIRIGDFVYIPSIKENVYIRSIGFRSTIADNTSGDSFILPNDSIAHDNIKNISMKHKRTKMPISFKVSYDTDVKVVFDIVCNAITEHPLTDKSINPPRCIIGDIGDYSFIIKSSFLVDNIEQHVSVSPDVIKSEIIETITKNLMQKGIKYMIPAAVSLSNIGLSEQQ